MGHLRKLRFAGILGVSLLVTSGVGVAMAEGGIAANLALSGTVFKMRVGKMVGDEASLFVGGEKVLDNEEGVTKLRFNKARVTDLCMEAPMGNIPGVGDASFVMRVDGENFSADNLLLGAQKLTGDITMHNPQIGIDAHQVDDRAPDNAWGLTATQMVVANQDIFATSVAADQLTIAGSKIDIVRKGKDGGC